MALSDGRFSSSWNSKARFAAVAGTVMAVFGPMVWSLVLWNRYQEVSEGTVPVVIAQPDFDPYHKFQSMTQDQQNVVLLDQFAQGLKEMRKEHPDDTATVLLLAPETFTSDILCNDVPSSRTFQRFVSFLRGYPRAEILFGASSWTRYEQAVRPSANARKMGDGDWYESHNSALIVDSLGRFGLYQKSKLVPGVEMLPYVKVLGPIDDKLLGGVAGRCVGQPAVSNLLFRQDLPVGCAVCYESVYGEHCASYVRAGAKLLTIITNDAWWGETPGYRQHLNYARLRAIETRRDIARCANTGISAFIDQKGRILSRTKWWEPAVLRGTVNLSSRETFFVRAGDLVGRLCVFLSVLLLAAAIIRRKELVLSVEFRTFVSMKKLVVSLLLALAGWTAFGQQIPGVSLQDGAGKVVTTASLIDHKTPFVISIWMTTCKPCLKELDTLSEEIPDFDGGFPLRIYAVSMDDSRSIQRAVAMAQGRDWEGITALFDVNADLRRALNVSSVPQVFVYDKEGKLFYTHIGYRPGDEQELLNQVRKCYGK